MPRTIAVFTGARAEYGLLKSVIRNIVHKGSCALQTIVSGTHLSSDFGSTIEEIRNDGIPVHHIVEAQLTGGTQIEVCGAMGEALARYAKVLQSIRPDLLILLGDRFETFSMAAAATVCQIPIAHIHGGEATEGLIDEPFRHAITKMSHIHFAACEAYRQRIIQLGESPDRVFTVGSLGVENVKNTELLDASSIRKELNLPDCVPYLLCTMHPVTLDRQSAREQISGVCEALNQFPEFAVVFTGANADPGGTEINVILRTLTKNSQHRFFMSLGQKRYFSAVKYAACVIGNSSSGIIEVPSFRTPVIDIGDRQKGRVGADSVIHCEANVDAIVKALAFAFSKEYRKILTTVDNPYDIPGTAQCIVESVASLPLDGILQKHFYDIPCHERLESTAPQA